MWCTIGLICNQCTGFVARTTYTYVILQPYTLQMRIAPNAKCQRVLVLALKLVVVLFDFEAFDHCLLQACYHSVVKTSPRCCRWTHTTPVLLQQPQRQLPPTYLPQVQWAWFKPLWLHHQLYKASVRFIGLSCSTMRTAATVTATTFILIALYQVNMGSWFPLGFFSTRTRRKPLGILKIIGTGFLLWLREQLQILWWVCLFVDLSVHEDISRTTCAIFTKLYACCLCPWLGSYPTCLR